MIQRAVPVDAAADDSIKQRIERLRQRFEFRNEPDVTSYLVGRPHLIDLLVETRPVIARYFGEEAPVVLEVVEDPEGDDVRELYAVIRTALKPPASSARLEEFDQGWWFAASEPVFGELIVAMEHV